MSNPFTPGDWAELLVPAKKGKRSYQPGTRGQVYGISITLVGLNLDSEGTREIVMNCTQLKKLPNNKLFPVKHRIIEA